jgi:ribosome-associated heat shock protein Hsp15
LSRRHAPRATAEEPPRPGTQGHPGLLAEDVPGAGVRLDKWLWAARFFKTRSLATEAVEAGRVRFHGDRPKPSRPVRIGDTLEVRCAGGIFQVAVIGLAERRGPASLAQALYREDPDSRRVREELAARRRAEALIRPWKGRPTKRERRALVKFTRA